jgi:pimeloyl-ACP methyl ester carboxylesterase
LQEASVDKAVTLLYDFLKNNNRRVHLIGHGIGGIIALLFARKYPQFARSLTLLSVAAQPANTWHTHYYQQLKLLDISHKKLMTNIARDLFQDELPCCANKLIAILNKDLDTSPLMHSLFKVVSLPKGGVSIPLMVCGSQTQTDAVINYQALHDWKRYLKTEDIIWNCPQGGHFFHYFHPEEVGEKILTFWQGHHKHSVLPGSTANSSL